MGLKYDVEAGIDGVLTPEWSRRSGTTVPETDDIVLKNGAVDIDATYLYADMADSTGLAQGYRDWAVAKVIRCYLNAASRIINARGGEIRSFDGDRVMGIFIGDSKNSDAAKAALQIQWAVATVINPKLKAKWDSFEWTMKQGIGIDTGEAMLVRGGVRGHNDLVSVGHAPNIAAKLSEERAGYPICITEAVRNRLSQETRYSKGVDMWVTMGTRQFGGKTVSCYSSNYWWEPT